MHLLTGIANALRAEPTGHVLQIQHKTSDYGIVADASGTLFTNKGASGAVQLNLPSSPHPGCYFLFCVRAAQQLRINPPDGGAIIIGGAALTDGNYVWADDEGESLLLFSDGDNSNDWTAMLVVGTWTEQA